MSTAHLVPLKIPASPLETPSGLLPGPFAVKEQNIYFVGISSISSNADINSIALKWKIWKNEKAVYTDIERADAVKMVMPVIVTWLTAMPVLATE